jgi:hypothetical protein
MAESQIKITQNEFGMDIISEIPIDIVFLLLLFYV